MRKALAEPLRGRSDVEVGAAIAGKAPDFPGAGDLRGDTTQYVVANAIRYGAVVDAPAVPANGLGDEVDPIALLTHFESLDHSYVDATRNGVAELSQGLSFIAEATVAFHIHFCAAAEALKPST